MDTSPVVPDIETLITQYQKLVFHTIYGLTNDWEESQDLTQDTFHQALRGLEAARNASKEDFHPKAWLLRIALNTVRMQRRRHSIFRFVPFSRMPEAEQQNEHDAETLTQQALPVQPAGYSSPAGSDPADLIAEQDAVQRTLAQLPEQFRECLLLSIVAGLSPSEIARLLDLKEPAVRQRLSRARKQFQQVYTQESGEELYNSQAEETKIHKKSAHSRARSAPTSLTDHVQRFSLSAQP